MLLAVDAGVERRVRVTGRLAAGVPDNVLRQWQVMGSRAAMVVVGCLIGFASLVCGAGEICC